MKINKDFKKIDSSSLVTGKPVYTEDLKDPNALIIKLMRSPYARCEILEIDKSRAEAMDGIVAVYTYEDVFDNKFTLAGQSYPEPSPYDMSILSKEIRYMREPVAIVVGVNEKVCNQAMKKIKIKYDVKEPLLDYTKAIDNEIIVHEEDVFFNGPTKVFGYDTKRNLVGEKKESWGEDVDKVMSECDVVLEDTFTTKAQAHCMMETYRSYCYMDQFDRLCCITSTQVPFHIKRQLSVALGISDSRIRIIKPRVGGGFGGKQTSVTEIYPGFVTLKTGKPSILVFDREETFEASNSRHQMKVKVKIGAKKDGTIEACDIYALSDQGAYGYHAFTTLNLVGNKTLPLYSRMRAARFFGQVVYTNKLPGGAFRGYGAVQGTFALESMVNKLAKELNMDPVELRLKNTVREGEKTLAYGIDVKSCKLNECIEKAREMIEWDKYYPFKEEKDKIISVGMAIAQQGSGIQNVDTSTVEVRLNEQGDYTLLMSPTDVGQGTDSIMVNLANEVLQCGMDNIIPIIADTDITPFDPGSYASSGVYITGSAVVRACENLLNKIKKRVAMRFETSVEWLEIRNQEVYLQNKKLIAIKDLARDLSTGPNGMQLIGVGNFDSKTSPPPYMAGFAKISIDKLTGEIKVEDYAAVVDCGTVMNTKLATVQVEGGIGQSIGYALYEDSLWDDEGRLKEHSFISYNLPSRKDIGNIHVDFCESYEPTGPFGAKSIGEIVSNTPAPAINGAILNALGCTFDTLPIKAEDVLLKMYE